MLNTFAGGPLDGMVISTKDLLQSKQCFVVVDYNWTKELVPTRVPGETARVWQYKYMLSPEVTQQVSAGTTHYQEDREMAETVEFSTLETKRREADISRQQLANRIGGALGTPSKVYRIERAQDDSKRTTEEERKAYVEALDALVAEKAEKAKADAALAEQKAKEKAEAEAAKAKEPKPEPAATNGKAKATANATAAAEDPNAPAF